MSVIDRFAGRQGLTTHERHEVESALGLTELARNKLLGYMDLPTERERREKPPPKSQAAHAPPKASRSTRGRRKRRR